MIKPVQGSHCEICLTPKQDDWHKHVCRFFHGYEYVCPSCVERLDKEIPNLVKYFEDTGTGCLFEEIMWADARLNKEFVRH